MSDKKGKRKAENPSNMAVTTDDLPPLVEWTKKFVKGYHALNAERNSDFENVQIVLRHLQKNNCFNLRIKCITDTKQHRIQTNSGCKLFECEVAGNCRLFYIKMLDGTVQLVDVGTHSKFF